MKTYIIKHQDFGRKFSFNAKDDKEANSKMLSWLNYHNFLSIKSEFSFEKIQETEPKDLHNEYINDYF